jgi:hypothetical protein
MQEDFFGMGKNFRKSVTRLGAVGGLRETSTNHEDDQETYGRSGAAPRAKHAYPPEGRVNVAEEIPALFLAVLYGALTPP